MNTNVKLAITLLLFPLAAVAADFPGPVLPQGVGVNIHFVTNHQDEPDLIAAAGFKFVRMDFTPIKSYQTNCEFAPHSQRRLQ